MREKTKIIIGSILLVLLLFSLSYWRYKHNNRPFKKHKFSDHITIINRVNNPRLDTIVYVLANDVYKYDTLAVVLQKSYFKIKNFKFYGVTHKVDSVTYVIYMNSRMDITRNKLVLSHEFIHINQRDRGDLELKENGYIWKNQSIGLHLDYKSRPHEIEAFEDQWKILKRLNKHLY